MGKLAFLATFGFGGGFPDPPKTATIESRLQGLIWVNDIAMGGDYIGNYDIHAIDAALWVVGQRPVAAAGASRICRPDPHGDRRDVCSVVYEFADGLVLNHTGNALKNNADGLLLCQVFGQTANAQVNYWGKAFVRGGDKHFGGGSDREPLRGRREPQHRRVLRERRRRAAATIRPCRAPSTASSPASSAARPPHATPA